MVHQVLFVSLGQSAVAMDHGLVMFTHVFAMKVTKGLIARFSVVDCITATDMVPVLVVVGVSAILALWDIDVSTNAHVMVPVVDMVTALQLVPVYVTHVTMGLHAHRCAVVMVSACKESASVMTALLDDTVTQNVVTMVHVKMVNVTVIQSGRGILAVSVPVQGMMMTALGMVYVMQLLVSATVIQGTLVRIVQYQTAQGTLTVVVEGSATLLFPPQNALTVKLDGWGEAVNWFVIMVCQKKRMVNLSAIVTLVGQAKGAMLNVQGMESATRVCASVTH